MRTATEKQAGYINELSYRLYELNGAEDIKVIMPYETALGLTYEIAEDMIDKLKSKIKKVQFTKYFDELSQATKFRKLENFPSLRMVENFKKIDKFEIDTDKKKATITTINGMVYNFTGDNLRTHDFCLTYKELFLMLKGSIDSDIEVGIIQTDKYIVITPTEKINEFIREKYLKQIELYNKVLEFTDGVLPVNSKGAIEDKSFEIIIELAERLDNSLYHQLKEQYNLDHFRGIKELLIKARTHEYNIVSTNRKIIIG